MSKELVFQSVESLQQVVNVINEAAAALNDKTRTIRESPIPEVLAGALGAGIGGIGSFAALYGLGTVGLSAVGITSGLATIGSVVGGTARNKINGVSDWNPNGPYDIYPVELKPLKYSFDFSVSKYEQIIEDGNTPLYKLQNGLLQGLCEIPLILKNLLTKKEFEVALATYNEEISNSETKEIVENFFIKIFYVSSRKTELEMKKIFG